MRPVSTCRPPQCLRQRSSELGACASARCRSSCSSNGPAYRLSGRAPLIVFADTGETFAGLDRVGAADVARQWAPAGRQIRYDAYLTEPDQWTLQTTLPVHRFAVDDMTGTYVYVSQATGEVVQRTTRRERFWASLGPVLHWIYFTRLRKHGRLWNNVVIWSSLVGCVLCATGLLWGCLQFSLGRRFRIRGAPAASPYTELMKWHHYAGLFFGLVTLTWVYSGLLSLEPFNWFASDDFTPEQREAAAGGPLRVDQLTLDSMRTALSIFPFEPKQLDVVQVRGEPFWVAQRAPSQQSVIAWMDAALLPRAPRPPLKRYYASAIHPERGLRLRFAPEAMEDIAHAVMAGARCRTRCGLCTSTMGTTTTLVDRGHCPCCGFSTAIPSGPGFTSIHSGAGSFCGLTASRVCGGGCTTDSTVLIFHSSTSDGRSGT